MHLSHICKSILFVTTMIVSGCSKKNGNSSTLFSNFSHSGVSDSSLQNPSSVEQEKTNKIDISATDDSELYIGQLNKDGNIVWGKNIAIVNPQLCLSTFGSLNENGTLKNNAYGYPEAGGQSDNSYNTGWQKIKEGDGYYQFDIYFMPYEMSINPMEDTSKNNICISDINIACDEYDEEINKAIAEAARLHIQTTRGENRLISKNKISEDNPLPLFGPLDLNGDGMNDEKGGYEWDDNPQEEIIYGVKDEYQTTIGVEDIIQTRDANGKQPDSDKRICIAQEEDYSKITLTIWLEGWSLTKNNWHLSTNNISLDISLTFDNGRM